MRILLIALLPLNILTGGEFESFINPATRLAALKNWLGQEEPSVHAQSLDHFRKTIKQTYIFSAPQPSRPEAVVLLWVSNNFSYDPDNYDPHPEEMRRNEEYEKRTTPWKQGTPWLSPCSLLLLDRNGVVPDSYEFLGCGTLADFDGDGNMDLLEIQRLHIDEKTSQKKRELHADLVGIRPIDPGEPPFGSWLVNVRDRKTQTREFQFSIKPKEKSFALLLTSADDTSQDIFSATNATIYQLADTGIWDGTSVRNTIISKLGFEDPQLGVGTDEWWELKKDGHSFSFSNQKPLDLKLPENTATLTPAEAAIQAVEINRSEVHRQYYDLAFQGKEIPVKSGWVEVTITPGWSDEIHSIWWLPDDGPASCWEYRDNSPGIANYLEIPRDNVSWWMAWLLALDQIRSIPKFPGGNEPENYRIGGADHTIIAINTTVLTPKQKHVEFEAVPTFWYSIRGPYNREIASLIASAAPAPPHWNMKSQLEEKNLLALAAEWLKPDNLTPIPPPLLRHTIQSIGSSGKTDFLPTLATLQGHLAELSAEERRLATIEKSIAESQKEKSPYWYEFPFNENPDEVIKFQNLDREMRQLKKALSGEPGYELREEIGNAVFVLKEAKKNRK